MSEPDAFDPISPTVEGKSIFWLTVNTKKGLRRGSDSPLTARRGSREETV